MATPATLLDGTEQVDEARHVIGAHVEHRPAAVEIVEAGIGMPALMAGAHEEGGAADRLADRAGVDELARGLLRAAEEGVRRGADAHALRLRRLDQLLRLGGGDAERLLAVHMLAGRDGAEADLDMGLRHREVDDDLDRGIGEHRVDRHRLEPELGGARLGRCLVQVGDATHVEDRETPRRLEIGRADIAAAYETDPDAIRHVHLPRMWLMPAAYRCGAGPVVPQGAP